MATIVTAPQWVGIDVSQAWLDIVLRPAGTDWRLSNQESGWAELVTHHLHHLLLRGQVVDKRDNC